MSRIGRWVKVYIRPRSPGSRRRCRLLVGRSRGGEGGEGGEGGRKGEEDGAVARREGRVAIKKEKRSGDSLDKVRGWK